MNLSGYMVKGADDARTWWVTGDGRVVAIAQEEWKYLSDKGMDVVTIHDQLRVQRLAAAATVATVGVI